MKYRNKTKRLIAGWIFVLAFAVFLLAGCGNAENHTAKPENGMYCTISISCHNALEQYAELPEGVLELLPKDGWILKETVVPLQEDASVFDVLLQTVQDYAIHMEYTDTPVYDSAYIEGIGNLYEFDAGEHSGWMYSVNGEFPNYGCSSYQVNNGDRICLVYTCNLGDDVGNAYGTQQ